MFLTETCYNIISRSDREVGEFGGVLIASRSNGDLEALYLTTETFLFVVAVQLSVKELHHSWLISTYL